MREGRRRWVLHQLRRKAHNMTWKSSSAPGKKFKGTSRLLKFLGMLVKRRINIFFYLALLSDVNSTKSCPNVTLSNLL